MNEGWTIVAVFVVYLFLLLYCFRFIVKCLAGGDIGCQSARKRDPGSACKKDPRDHPFVRFSSAILPSRPMRLLSRRAQRRSRTAAFGGRPQGLFLRAVSTTA